MNELMRDLAKSELKINSALLPEGWQTTFKLMYGRDGGKRSVEEAKAMSIDAIVDGMADNTLDWAMIQVDNSLAKLQKEERRNG